MENMRESDIYNYPGYPSGFKSLWKFPLPSEKERDLRWNEVRKAMRENHLDCLILGGASSHVTFPNNNIYYISNYVPFFNLGTYIVFPLEGEPQIAVSSSIGPQFLHCASETSWIREIVQHLQPAEVLIRKIRNLKLEKGALGVVGYRTGVFPASTNDMLHAAFPKARFAEATSVLAQAQNEVSRTSREELAFLKKTAEIHDISFNAVAKAFKPGVNEQVLWAAAEKAIIENGGWSPHFMLVTAGPSPIFPRAPASNYTLVKGDVIVFEINVVYGGILSQTCYALSLGEPEKNTAKMYGLVEELYQWSLAEHGKHKTFGEVENGLIDRIYREGYRPMTPQIHIYNQSVDMPADKPAQPGDYFTVHPNVCTRDYTAGAKLGDTIRINRNGKVERLQKTSAKLHIINP